MLLVGISVADILLVGKLIEEYMKDHNIIDPNLVDEKFIQTRYDEIMTKFMWENPERFPHIKCPKCHLISYNTNDIKHKFCSNCHEWHEDMKGI